MGLGQRFTHSTASCMDFTCHSQYPATSSLVSVIGPSITVRLAPENRTRFPSLLGLSPSPASMMPAFTSSSLNAAISFKSFSSPGLISTSDSLVAFTMTITRMVVSLSGWPGSFAGLLVRRTRPCGIDILRRSFSLEPSPACQALWISQGGRPRPRGRMVLDASQVAKFRDVRNEYFKSDPPASTALEVRALLRPEYLVEMDVIAVAK